MAFSARAVGNYLIGLANADRIPLTPMQIQKLVYYAHGWHLALREKPLIRETVEAWDYGPVIADLYHGVKRHGAGVIDRPIQATRFTSGMFETYEPSIDRETVDDSDANESKRLIRQVWEVNKKFTALELSAMTHKPNGPWAKVRAENPGKRGVDIPDEMLKEHFRTLAAEAKARQHV